MADTTTEETPGQRAARLRREKRGKKFAESGADRLASITSASGREQDLQPQSLPKAFADSSDPPEVDISSLPPSFAGRNTASSNTAQQDPFLAMMQQAQQGGGGGMSMPGFDGAGGGPNANDPIMQMMQQMFSPPPGTGGAPIPGAAGMPGGPPDGLPPGLAAMLGGGAAAPGSPPPSTSGYIWRIVHAIFSLLLAAYVAFVLPFDGSRSERDSPLAETKSVFWIFATVELGLQSARYMLEKSGSSGVPPGWMGTVMQFLPVKYANWLKLGLRYSGYWTTLVEDAMGVVFVLGAVAWWKGQVET